MTFKTSINIDGTQRHIHFHGIKKGTEDVFLVSVIDGNGMPAAFTMAKSASDHWNILPQALPDWATHSVSQISDIINEHITHHPLTPHAPFSPWNLISD